MSEKTGCHSELIKVSNTYEAQYCYLEVDSKKKYHRSPALVGFREVTDIRTFGAREDGFLIARLDT